MALSASLGFCALDARRRPLTGLELRGCWAERPPVADADAAARPRAVPTEVARRAARAFVPIGDVVARPPAPDATLADPVPRDTPTPAVIADAAETWEQRTSLFGDLDR